MGLALLIDAGNSRLKWGISIQSQISESHQEKHFEPQSLVFADYIDEAAALAQLEKTIISHEKVSSIWVSNVRGLSFVTALNALCDRLAWPRVHYAYSKRSAYGITNAYQHAETLGIDRFVALLAGHYLYPNTACIVVDSGTAVTIDAISITGEHRGGLILPGLSLWRDSLIKGTTALNKNLIYNPNEYPLFANNTSTGVSGGSALGLALAIEGICLRMERKLKEEGLGASVTRIICGGDAQCILSVLDKDVRQAYRLHEHLILTGLEIIAKRQWECVG